MKDFIEKEKNRLQALFEPFNAGGSWMTLAENNYKTVRLGLVDGFTVTRVAPHFSSAGEITHVDFWLLIKMVGYHEGFQHAHTIKVISWSQEDSYLLDLTDDRGRRFHIELIFPELERNLAADWKTWTGYKAKNHERFESIDADIFSEHLAIAEEWP